MTRAREAYENERMMRYDARKKSALLAYVLWFFLGMFGVHRFYLGRWVSGIMMLALSVVGGALTFILVGYILLGIVGLWWLLDALLTYGMVEGHNERLAMQLS